MVDQQVVIMILTLLLRMNTGPSDSPSVQQQQRHPHNRYLTLKGTLFSKIVLMYCMVDWNSSGATYHYVIM